MNSASLETMYILLLPLSIGYWFCQNSYLLEKIVNINLKIQPASLYPSMFLKRTTLLVHQNCVSQQKVWMFSLMYWEMGEEVVMAAVETIVMLMMVDLLVCTLFSIMHCVMKISCLIGVVIVAGMGTKCPSYRESNKWSKKRQGSTLV